MRFQIMYEIKNKTMRQLMMIQKQDLADYFKKRKEGWYGVRFYLVSLFNVSTFMDYLMPKLSL